MQLVFRSDLKILSSIIFFLFNFCLIAEGQEMKITNYYIDVQIHKEGYVDVKEIIDVVFNTERRGILRNIPRTASFNNKTRDVELSKVKVKNYNFTILKEANDNVIRVGDVDKYLTGPKTYELSYRLSNIFIFEDYHIEFIYNLISGWDCIIENIEYNVGLPSNLEMAFNDYKIITGDDGEDERNATIQKTGRRFHGKSTKMYFPYENVTIAIKLPMGYIEKPVPPPTAFQRDKIWLLPLSLIAFVIAFFKRSRKEIQPEEGGIEHYPPEGLSPAEVGAYHDYRVNTEDVIALLPYWANMGCIKILSSEIGSKELFFKKINPLEPDAPEYQHLIFDEIFNDGELVMLSELKNKLYRSVSRSGVIIKKALIEKELYDMDHYNLFHTGKFIAAGIVLFILGIVIISSSQYTITGISVILLGISSFVIHFLRPKRSDKGIMIKAHLDRLKRFLDSSTPDENQRMMTKDPSYFEKLYPYAIALGVDKSWLDKLNELDVYAPYWYGYNNHSMQNRVPIRSFSNEFSVPQIKSVFTSYPKSSSGSSGSFSGGSAGGGFGGGGSSW